MYIYATPILSNIVQIVFYVFARIPLFAGTTRLRLSGCYRLTLRMNIIHKYVNNIHSKLMHDIRGRICYDI